MRHSLDLSGSYFSIANPLDRLDRWLNPFRHCARTRLGDREVIVEWTDRAQQALEQRDTPLRVEMQLYFSCVVKKRVLFDEHAHPEAVPVSKRISVSFRAVASDSCTPERFVRDFPVSRELGHAKRGMMADWLRIDLRRGEWLGEFGYRKKGGAGAPRFG